MKDPSHRFQSRFEEWTPLAEGGEGRLYRVFDRWSGRLCALKTNSGAAGEAALTQEFRLLGKLRHPCVLRSLDLVRDEEGLGHVVEYVPAVPPARVREIGGEPAVRAALVQGLRGLAYLHRHGWVHGDVAPGNLLVWREGESWRAKLADFGLATEAVDAPRSGVRGTPGYMAPEVARGEGLGAATDLFGLAATAVCWIDGRGPWDDLRPEETLRAAAHLASPVAPRRTIGPELRRLIDRLGQPRPADRRPPSWEDLRDDPSAWGPPVLEPGVFGLHAAMKVAVAEAELLAPGVTRVVAVQGRAGSGRRTFAVALARELTAAGWTSLIDMPLTALRDWLASGAADPDPVRLARRLTERFAGSDLVLVWPENLPEFEIRLFQAFTAARGGPDAIERTLIVRVAPAGGQGPVDGWLRGARRVTELPWEVPVEAGLDAIARDLFSEEDGYADDGRRRPRPRAGETPLSLILLRRASLEGREAPAVSEGVDAVAAEVDSLWRRLDVASHDALALIAASSAGWSEASLALLLGWEAEEAPGRFAALAGLALLRGDYEGGERRLRPADWMAREALVRRARAGFDPARMAAVGAALEACPEVHPDDLSLATAFAETGVFLPRYALGALDRALAHGRFDAVLRFRDVVETMLRSRAGQTVGDAEGAPSRAEFLARYLRAAKQLGRFAVEEEILKERLLAAAGTSAEYDVRVDLAKALFALGRWQEAVTECEAMQSVPGIAEEQRLWAELQRAEVLWQVGRFEEADQAYERLETAIPGTSRHLWLKFGLGRGRSAAQQEQMRVALEWLELAAKCAGKEVAEADSLYLNTRAGLAQALQSADSAVELCGTAVHSAETSSDWVAYVMANSRWSASEAARGNLVAARRIAGNAVTAALALGSLRLATLARCYEGHWLSELGYAQQVIDFTRWACKVATEASDGVLLSNVLRLQIMVASKYGWFPLVEDATELLKREVRRDHKSFLLTTRSTELVVGMRLDEALTNIRDAIEALNSKETKDTAIEFKILEVGVLLHQRRFDDALPQVPPLIDEAQVRGLHGSIRILRMLEIAWKNQADTVGDDQMEPILDEVLSRGQRADALFWSLLLIDSPLVTRSSELVTRVKRRILSNFQFVAGQIQEERLRRAFLEAPLYRETLAALASS